MPKKLIITVIGLALFGSSLWTWYDAYNKAPDVAEHQLNTDADLTASLLNAEDYATLCDKRTIPREKYNQLLKPLLEFHKTHPEIAHIYTISKIGNELYYILDTSSKINQLNPNQKFTYPSKGIEKIQNPDDGIKNALKGEASTEKNEPLRFPYGADIARYLPLKTKTGEVVGVLALTMNKIEATKIQEKTTKEFVKGLITYAIMGLSLIVILWQKRKEIKRKELTLERTEEQLKTLTEQIPGVVYIYSTRPKTEKGNLLFLSEGSKNILSKNKREAEEDWKEITDILPEGKREEERKHVRRCRSDNTAWECEFQNPETKVWVQNRATPKKDENGNTVWFGTLNDISLQKMETKKLGETNKILKRISESPDSSVTLNTICEYACALNDEAILHINQGDETITIAGTRISKTLIAQLQIPRKIGNSAGGASVASIQKNKLHIPSIQDSSFYRNAEELKKVLLEEGFKSTTIYPLINKENTCLGSLEILHNNYKPEEENNAKEEQAAHLALSALERHQVQKTLEENEKRYRTLFETSPIGICETDENGEIAFSNQAFKTIMGTESILSLSGKNALEGKKEIKQGTSSFLAETSTIEKANGKHHLITFLSDISEQKQKEEKAITSKELAEAANKAKSEFLAVMSHEIRTPLNGVIGVSQILEEMKLGEKERRLVSQIRQSGETLLATISDILDISKIEAGRIELEIIAFNLTERLNTIKEILMPRTRDKKIYIKVETENLPEVILGDETKIGQIILNLAGNAVKFTEQGGVTIFASYQTNLLTLKIKDTGIGISEENQKKLFQPFTQADSSTTRKYGGTGLGLIICKKLAERMGGSIQLQTQKGKGSTFTVTIPTKIGETQTNKKKKEEEVTEDLLPLNILIAEDDEVNRLVIEGLLKACGHNIEFAKNGLEAVEKSKELYDWTDIILMDMRMPEMDGLEATKKIREIEKEEGKKPKLIYALTANALEEDREKCVKAGMNNYLSKPINLVILKKALLIPQRNKRKIAAQEIKEEKKKPEPEPEPELKPEPEPEPVIIELETLDVLEQLEHLETVGDLEKEEKTNEVQSEAETQSEKEPQAKEEPQAPIEDQQKTENIEIETESESESESKPEPEERFEPIETSSWGFGTEETEPIEEKTLLIKKSAIKEFITMVGIEKIKNVIYPKLKESCILGTNILLSTNSTALEKQNAAHKMCGSLGTFGCIGLGKLTKELETHYEKNDNPHPNLNVLKETVEKTLEEFEEILDKEE